MRKHSHIWIFLLVVATLLVACSSGTRPEKLLSPEDMVPLIKDMEICYAGVDQMVKDPKERTLKYQELNGLVFKKHGVDQEQFYDSYKYYEAQPIVLDTIFKQVLQLLNDELKSVGPGGQVSPTELPDMN